MADVRSVTTSLRKMAPKIIKATIKGFIWFLLLYALPIFILDVLSTLIPPSILFPGYSLIFGTFAAIVVFFVVAGELSSGTIFQHMFKIAKSLIMLVFFVYALSGGIIAFNFETVHIVADLRVFLAMLLIIDFVGLVKNVLQAVNFLSERAEAGQVPSEK